MEECFAERDKDGLEDAENLYESDDNERNNRIKHFTLVTMKYKRYTPKLKTKNIILEKLHVHFH